MKRQEQPKPVAEESLGEVLDFMRVLWALHHGLQSTSKRMSRTVGLTGPQRLVLRVLSKRAGLTAGELARLLHTDPSTLTGVLSRLEGRRLLKRELDENDARKMRLHLTADGKREARDRPGTVEARVREAMKTLSPESVRQTKKVLQALAASLEDEG